MVKTKVKIGRLEKNLNTLLATIRNRSSEALTALEDSKKLTNVTLEWIEENLLERTIEIETTSEFIKLQKITGQLKDVNHRAQEVFLIFPEQKPFNSGSYKISDIQSIKIVK